jgi:cysteinyl-tRNA synthetase
MFGILRMWGILIGDVDTGAEDKIGRIARLEQLEPMEIVQKYTNGFHDVMSLFNSLNPNIEPSATGHIIEQIEMVQKILDNGLAYEINGSVYFDTVKYAESTDSYGKLSGRVVEELMSESRDNLKEAG